MNAFFDAQTLFIIFAGALATYITRAGGYVLMTRMKTIPPRVEAGLNAVPVAVLTTLVAPAFFEGGYEVKIGIVFALIVGLRYPGLIMLISGWALVVAMRYFSIA
jgi:uncharacterized membrane protein